MWSKQGVASVLLVPGHDEAEVEVETLRPYGVKNEALDDMRIGDE